MIEIELISPNVLRAYACACIYVGCACLYLPTSLHIVHGARVCVCQLPSYVNIIFISTCTVADVTINRVLDT